MDTIFISGTPEVAKARELWQFFQKAGNIKDIILPKKRDKNNRRIGFVKVHKEGDVGKIMKQLQYEVFYSQPLKMNVAKNKQKIHSEALPPQSAKGPTKTHMDKDIINSQEVKVGAGEYQNNKDDKSEHLKGKKKEKIEKENTKPVILETSKEIESIALRSTICFSQFPLKGDILQDIIDELGYKDIIVKEVSCYKFILSFKTKKIMDNFQFDNLVDWVHLPRRMEEEDFRIKRKILVEIRGLPCNTWTEDNLQKILKDLGSWGWWENNPMYHSSLENPRIWMYSESLGKVREVLKVIISGSTLKIKVHEIENAELLENLRRTMIPEQSSPKTKGDEDIQETVIRKEVPKDEIIKEETLPLKGGKKKEEGTPQDQLVSPTKEQNWEEFEKLTDNDVNDSHLDESINTGDLQTIDEGLQNSICNLIQKIKLCRNKKKKKRIFKGNPFDIGRCKLSKINKSNRRNNLKSFPTAARIQKGADMLEKEATEIIQMAEDMGLKLKKSKEETIKEIKEQLRSSLI